MTTSREREFINEAFDSEELEKGFESLGLSPKRPHISGRNSVKQYDNLDSSTPIVNEATGHDDQRSRKLFQ
jgi:hypothetical protein